jgi:diguanylate cyclase (GGDEF)-like protein/PAS domain S-box-containing protein
MTASGTSSEERLLEFLYACPVGLIECDMAGEIALMNPHAMQHLLPLAGIRDTGNLFAALEQHAPELRSIVARFAPPTGRICDGHRIVVDLGSGQRAHAPKVLSCTLVKLGADRLMATLSDISQQVVQEEQLRQADSWFATLLDDGGDYAALTLTASGTITSANAIFTQQTGYDHTVVVGRDLADLVDLDPPGSELRVHDQVAIAARDGWHLQELPQQRADGEQYWCQRLVVARTDGGSQQPSGFSVVLRDVPRRDTAGEDVRRLLTCDDLTGVSNRRHFSRMLEREQAQWREMRQPLSLVTLDLDHFKSVNDRYGHPIGDLLLCRVAQASAALLPPLGIFARLGGEEFGALLPGHDTEGARALAEAIRHTIETLAIETPHGPLNATASLGYATLDEVEGSTDALLALADQRLYAAKHAGRNRVHHPLSCAA